MTIRRDLQVLEDRGKFTRIHGAATINSLSPQKISHNEKRKQNISAKKIIAQHIHNDETIFIGAGTTLELIYNYLKIDRAKIITNSIHVFNRFRHDERFELILVGENYRPVSGAFVGTLVNDFIDKIKVQKAFIGVNGIYENGVYNANEDEGLTNYHILNSASERYVVADTSKLDKQDFYMFYNLDDLTQVITEC